MGFGLPLELPFAKPAASPAPGLPAPPAAAPPAAGLAALLTHPPSIQFFAPPVMPPAERLALSPAADPAWLVFWFEPWRWADPQWMERFGASWPGTDAARRSCYRPWCLRLDLALAWQADPDPAWAEVIASPPAALRRAAVLVGHAVRLVLDPGSRPGDDAGQQARRYLMSRPLHMAGEAGWHELDHAALGLCALVMAGRETVPEALPRLRMMLAPDLACRGDRLLRPAAGELAHHARLWRAALRWAQRTGEAGA